VLSIVFRSNLASTIMMVSAVGTSLLPLEDTKMAASRWRFLSKPSAGELLVEGSYDRSHRLATNPTPLPLFVPDSQPASTGLARLAYIIGRFNPRLGAGHLILIVW